MDKIEIDLSELVKVPDRLRKKMMNDWMDNALHLYGQELEAAVVDKIDSMQPPINYSGDLRKSIRYQVSKVLTKWFLKVGSGIVEPFPYPVVVHEGARPHWMPKSAMPDLIKWVEKKLGVPAGDAEGVAYAIRRKIAKKGKKGRPFLRVVFELEKPFMAQKISQYLAMSMKGGQL